MNYTKSLGPTTYGARSRSRLRTCHKDLQRVFKELANDGWDISVICGERDQIEQDRCFSSGLSNVQYPNSKHNTSASRPLSLAIDVAPYMSRLTYMEIAGDDKPWIILAGAVMSKSQELGIGIIWGGLFKNLKDLGHYEFGDV